MMDGLLLFSFNFVALYLIIDNAIRKKGINGILYLTNEPKLKVEMPIANAKDKENRKSENTSESLFIMEMHLKGPTFIIVKIKKQKKMNDSRDDKNIIVFLASHT